MCCTLSVGGIVQSPEFIYLMKNEQSLMRLVETGLVGEDDTEILSGLSSGEQVILSPMEDIEAGTRVRIKK